MAKWHTVKEGECISSIAFDNGFSADTVWQHADNEKLRGERKNMNVLLAGDKLYIPDKEQKTVPRPTGNKHRFRLRNTPIMLRIRFLDESGEPRAGLDYTLEIEGQSTRRGQTDHEGMIVAPILPDAPSGRLRLIEGEREYEYKISLGAIDPITEIKGVQQRLNNLGYHCSDEYGKPGEKTEACLRRFQQDHSLSINGEPDDATRQSLVRLYGG